MSAPRRRAGRGRLVAMAGAAALLGACGSLFTSKLAPTSVYVLRAEPAAGGPVLGADLCILAPRVRAGLDGTAIAALYPDRRLDRFAGAAWAGGLEELVQDLAQGSLRAHAGPHVVGVAAAPFATAYWLDLEVLDFQAEYGPGAGAPTIRVRLAGIVGTRRQALARFEVEETQRAEGDRLSAIVAAFETAANRVLDRIDAATAAAIAAAPPAPQ